jgi:deoxyadenosine/deoxycytidine kinase
MFSQQRRRERNRASQRAFRARKEKYIQDLQDRYIKLQQRYDGLLQLLQNSTGMTEVTGKTSEEVFSTYFVDN